MLLLHHIHDVIRNYPTLYKVKTYEESELLVLDHLFLTNGNGYEWYDGYLIDKFEEPIELYGVVKKELLPAGYFDKIEWKLEPVDESMRELFEEFGIVRNYVKKDGEYYREVKQVARPGIGSEQFVSFSPYPICQYAKMETMPDDVRPDWLAGAIKAVKATLAYYEDDEAIKRDFYYPSERYIAASKREFDKWIQEYDDERLAKVMRDRNITDEDMKDPTTYSWRSWNRHRKRQLKYVNDFLGEYQ